ncbi:hypothetical protein B7463_g11264, partial [Scytalidium lignicola]
MPWKGQVPFTSLDLQPWKSTVGREEKVAGEYKEVNIKIVNSDDKTTRFALVTIDGSGHMVSVVYSCFVWRRAAAYEYLLQVPQDQPEVALDMLTRRLAGKPFA